MMLWVKESTGYKKYYVFERLFKIAKRETFLML